MRKPAFGNQQKSDTLLFLCFILPALLLGAELAASLPASGEAGSKGSEEGGRGGSYNTDYTEFVELESLLYEMEEDYPEIMELHIIGETWEERNIYAVRLSDKDNETYQGQKEPELLFIGGIHARELMTVEMIRYLLEHLTGNYETDHDVRTMLDTTEIWLVPMLNPDGHVYVEQEDTNWRKNRRDNGDGSYGVDLNRNFGYEWGTDAHTSDDPDDDLYHGPEPFSEPESQAIRSLAENHSFSFSLSFHSAGREVLHPWGYESDAYSEDHELLVSLGDRLAKLSGYERKKASDLYPARGDSEDYLHSQGILSYTIEMGSSHAPSNFQPEIDRSFPMCLYLIHSASKISTLQQHYAPDGSPLEMPHPAPGEPILEREYIQDHLKAAHHWNWIIYMSGDSSLSSEVDDDLNQIRGAKIPNYLQIIVLADKRNDDDTAIYVLDSEGQTEVPLDQVNSNWGSELRLDEEETLTDFLRWASETYPAENTLLEFWGHGKGWKYSVHEGSESKVMDARELGRSLREGLSLHLNQDLDANWSSPLDIVGFDECAMANLENFAEIAPLTDYYIGSEKDEPFDGWPYSDILEELENRSLLLPWNFSATLSNAVVDFYDEHPAAADDLSVLFSVLRTRALDRFQELAGSLFTKLRNRLGNETFHDMLEVQRQLVEEYERNDFVDFYHYLSLIAGETRDFEISFYIDELLEIKDEIILLNLKTANIEGKVDIEEAQGFSIFFPERSSGLGNPYSSLAFNHRTGWYQFLYEYINGPGVGCSLKDASFGFTDLEKGEELATKVYSNFTLYSEIERDDLSLLINVTRDDYQPSRETGPEPETILVFNFTAEAGNQNYTLSFYENFSGTLRVELLVFSNLFKDGDYRWEGAEELSSTMSVLSRKADLYFQELSFQARVGPDALPFGDQNLLFRQGVGDNQSEIYLLDPVLGRHISYWVTLNFSSDFFSSYCLLDVRLDGESIYLENFFLRENRSETVSFPLKFSSAGHRLSFILDPNSSVSESDEENNVLDFNISAPTFTESVSLEGPGQEVELAGYLQNNSLPVLPPHESPSIFAVLNNSSPNPWLLNYFFGVKLVSNQTGEPYSGEVDQQLLDALILSFENITLLADEQLALEAGAALDFKLVFPEMGVFANFYRAHDDILVILEVIFYAPNSLTGVVVGAYENGRSLGTHYWLLTITFQLNGSIPSGGDGDPGNGDVEEDDPSSFELPGLLVLVSGVLITCLLLVMILLVTKKPDGPRMDPLALKPGEARRPRTGAAGAAGDDGVPIVAPPELRGMPLDAYPGEKKATEDSLVSQKTRESQGTVPDTLAREEIIELDD